MCSVHPLDDCLQEADMIHCPLPPTPDIYTQRYNDYVTMLLPAICYRLFIMVLFTHTVHDRNTASAMNFIAAFQLQLQLQFSNQNLHK